MLVSRFGLGLGPCELQEGSQECRLRVKGVPAWLRAF